MKNDFLSADRCFKLSAVSSELFKTKTVMSAAVSQQARHDICSPLAWEQSDQEVSVRCSVPFHVSNKVARLVQPSANWIWLIRLLLLLVKCFDWKPASVYLATSLRSDCRLTLWYITSYLNKDSWFQQKAYRNSPRVASYPLKSQL